MRIDNSGSFCQPDHILVNPQLQHSVVKLRVWDYDVQLYDVWATNRTESGDEKDTIEMAKQWAQDEELILILPKGV